MSWRTAFLIQAADDNAVRRYLNSQRVAYSHQLHYLQMTTEKLAKGFSIPATSQDPPEPVHSGFVRLLQTLKHQSRARQRLGFHDQASFRKFINSLLDLAYEIEHLAPVFAGFTRPNPEYPWRDAGNGQIIAPAEYPFAEFDPRLPKMIQIEALLAQLLRPDF